MRFSINKKVVYSALYSFLVAIIFYLLSFIKICKLSISLNSFTGIFLSLLISLCISSFWIFTYWNIDTQQKEPVNAILKTFVITLLIHFFLLYLFEKSFQSSEGKASGILALLKYVLIPIFTIYVVFVFSVFQMPSFDESVDSLIYGGFVGVGLGSAYFLNEIFLLDTVSIQYLIQSLVIRIFLCSSVCALTGLLFNKMRISSKLHHLVFLIIILFVVFSIYCILDNIIETNILVAQFDNLRFIVSVFLSFIIFVLTIILISKKINISFSETTKYGKLFSHIFGILIFLIIIINCFYIQNQMNKTVRYFSPDKNWSFELPDTFTEEKQASDFSTIFDKAESKTYQKYTNKKCTIYISFNVAQRKLDLLSSASKKIHGWTIYENPSDQSDVLSITIKKKDVSIMLQIEQINQNNYLDNYQLVRNITKSLKEEVKK